ncbi:MAG: acyl-CoA thioesterase [Elusimicrobiota bacterium]|jgi:acyl-CoA thioester hydrolase|nr:acyl-CoA thioesterase [Elusimicrobiota bacterium]
MKQEYFKQNLQDPKPLTATINRSVRFDELDPLNIMWHGNYASFFEEGRMALGLKYNISYQDFYKNDVVIPLKKFYTYYVLPLEFGKVYTIETKLHWNEAARLDFSYEILFGDILMTSGYSVHLMIGKDKNVLVDKPDFFANFCFRWKAGEIL